jgi:hypothetical protein
VLSIRSVNLTNRPLVAVLSRAFGQCSRSESRDAAALGLKIRDTALPVDQSFGSGNSSPIVKSSVDYESKFVETLPVEEARAFVRTLRFKRRMAENERK